MKLWRFPDAIEACEEVLFVADDETGLRGIIAIDSTALGPALGGLRAADYGDDGEALRDALRLSKGMTMKAAAAGLDLGGGKAVVFTDSGHPLSEARLEAFGRVVQSLNGRYITAEDMGTSVEDMDVIARATRWVAGTSPGKGGSGDPSAATARGVMQGIRAALVETYGDDELSGRSIAIQGVGKVGAVLCGLLVDRGATVVASDPNRARLHEVSSRFGVTAVDPAAIIGVAADVFSPCAIGGILGPDSIDRLRCRIVAGAANNQLTRPELALQLRDRGILYVPDFVINAGGLIQVAHERGGMGVGGEGPDDFYDGDAARARVDGIFDVLREILGLARDHEISTHEAAALKAEERLRRAAPRSAAA